MSWILILQSILFIKNLTIDNEWRDEGDVRRKFPGESYYTSMHG